ncbi:MAG: CRTAC1 family protein [Flavobacteriales bacterium]|nr:CRTAC1 family protein [Flavobacteriales bacterium]
MGSNFGDLDNDGYLDFYIGTGSPDFTSIVPNRMFRNVNGEGFEEVTSAGQFGHIQKGHAVAFADLDQDGDQDIYAVMGGAVQGDRFTNVLFENPISKNNWIVIELEGTKTNRNAIGTVLELTLDNGRKLYRTVSSGGSFGASSIQQEIGLGKATKIERLVIRWANNEVQTLEAIDINQKILIREGQKNVETIKYEPKPFTNHSNSHHHHH